MGGDVSSRCDEDIVLRKEVPDIAELGEKQENPRWRLGFGYYVDVLMHIELTRRCQSL